MANLVPVPGEDAVPQLDTNTRVLGGPDGPSNAQAQALLNRTAALKQTDAAQQNQIDSLDLRVDSLEVTVLNLSGRVTNVESTVNNLSDGSGSSQIGFIQNETNAVARTVQEKAREIFSVRDFDAGNDAADFTAAGAANGGGLTIIPASAYSLGSYEITADGHYLNGSGTLMSTWLFNAGETPNVKQTKHLSLQSFSGLNNGKIRIGYTQRMATTGAGSTIATNGTADVGHLINAYKANFNTTTIDGEIDGQIVVVRQGGGNLSDAAGTLYDVGTYSNSFACMTEGQTTKINSSNVITDRIRVITGFLAKGTNDMGGLSVTVENGTASNMQYMSINSGAGATNFQQFVAPATGIPHIYAMSATGATTTTINQLLSGTAPASVNVRSNGVLDTNNDRLIESTHRTSNGSDYTSAEWRLRRQVDSTNLPFVKWSALAALGRVGLAVAAGTEFIYVTDNGFLNIPASNLFNAANDAAAAAASFAAFRSMGFIETALC